MLPISPEAFIKLDEIKERTKQIDYSTRTSFFREKDNENNLQAVKELKILFNHIDAIQEARKEGTEYELNKALEAARYFAYSKNIHAFHIKEWLHKYIEPLLVGT